MSLTLSLRTVEISRIFFSAKNNIFNVTSVLHLCMVRNESSHSRVTHLVYAGLATLISYTYVRLIDSVLYFIL